jgi:hypothetical protein
MVDDPVQPQVQSVPTDPANGVVSGAPIATPTVTQTAPPSDMFSDASANATLQAVAQSTDPLNPPNVVGGRAGLGAKELTNVGTLDSIAQEVPGAQAVEVEKSAEIPPEVESFMESVEDHQFKAPQEVVVADATAQQPTGHYASEPVIVLPTTSQKVQEGKKKRCDREHSLACRMVYKDGEEVSRDGCL